MAKLVEAGDLAPQDWSGEFRCKSCNSLWELSLADLYRVDIEKYDMRRELDVESCIAFQCDRCGQETIIERSDKRVLPSWASRLVGPKR